MPNFRSRLLCLLFVLLALWGLPLTALAETSEWQGDAPGVPDFGIETARDEAAWNALWQRIGRTPPPAPAFARGDAAVAIFLGTRPTGGYRIIWARDIATQSLRIIEWEERRPTGFTTQVLTAPFAVRIVTDARQLPIGLRRRDETGVFIPETELGFFCAPSPNMPFATEDSKQRIQKLENYIAELENRLRRIENAVGNPPGYRPLGKP